MLATATHDHKRGEDARARLAAISEHALLWSELLARWVAQCRALSGGDAPHACDIAMLLQTIVGAWPLDLAMADANGRRTFAARLAQWQEKALREAKLATDWVLPNEAHERAARDLISALIERNAAPALLAEIADFVDRIAPAGAVNGLAQALLKLTLPGVPDIYQGTEFWDFSLVDPDNRRPVDFAARAAALEAHAPLMPANAGIQFFGQRTGSPLSRGRAEDTMGGNVSIETLLPRWRDGRIKQALIARVLALRAAQPLLFSDGSYEPLDVRGTHADKIVGFARRHDGDLAIVVVPRIASTLLRNGEVTFDLTAWQDTTVFLPQRCELVDIFTGDCTAGDSFAVHSLFGRLPLALLTSSMREST
jgi:maltooligosyltrehalose synthase